MFLFVSYYFQERARLPSVVVKIVTGLESLNRFQTNHFQQILWKIYFFSRIVCHSLRKFGSAKITTITIRALMKKQLLLTPPPSLILLLIWTTLVSIVEVATKAILITTHGRKYITGFANNLNDTNIGGCRLPLTFSEHVNIFSAVLLFGIPCAYAVWKLLSLRRPYEN